MADRDKLEAQYIAMGYDPALAAELAETATYGEEFDWLEGERAQASRRRGIRTPGRYGVFVADPSGALDNFRSAATMGRSSELFDRAQDATASWLSELGRGGTTELGGGGGEPPAMPFMGAPPPAGPGSVPLPPVSSAPGPGMPDSQDAVIAALRTGNVGRAPIAPRPPAPPAAPSAPVAPQPPMLPRPQGAPPPSPPGMPPPSGPGSVAMPPAGPWSPAEAERLARMRLRRGGY